MINKNFGTNKSIFINLLLIFLVILNPFSLSAQQLKVVKGEMCNTTSINAKIVESLNNEIYVAGYNALHEKIIFEKLNSNSSQIIAKSPKISTNSVVSYKDFRANESIIKFEDNEIPTFLVANVSKLRKFCRYRLSKKIETQIF